MTATLTATASTSEDGGSITYTVTLTGAPGAVDPDTALSFLLANGETVTIAAGAISGSVTVPVKQDDVYVEPECDHERDRVSVSAGGTEYESLVVDPAIGHRRRSPTMRTW